MNIYLISPKGYSEKCALLPGGMTFLYETFDSAVVVAETEDAARHTHPGGDLPESRWWELLEPLPEWLSGWVKPGDVDVKLIGVACDDIPRVVCASFNAG